MITRFLARAQIEAGASGTSPASLALSLLQGRTASGSNGLLSLLASKS